MKDDSAAKTRPQSSNEYLYTCSHALNSLRQVIRLVEPCAVKEKNYFFGGPALRCGGDTTRNRFGTDCPKEEEEDAEVATWHETKPAEAAGPPIEGLELR